MTKLRIHASTVKEGINSELGKSQMKQRNITFLEGGFVICEVQSPKIELCKFRLVCKN